MEKKYWFLGAVLLAAVLLLSGMAPRTQGKRVVFIGDSITDGNWGIVPSPAADRVSSL